MMSRYMKSTYEYTKLRRNFGRQPLLQDVSAQMLDSINPDKNEQKLYTLRNPVHRHIQATLPQSENDSNTKQVVTRELGINHEEGGWPREVHVFNEEHVARHRRRVMHEDNYVHAVLNLTPVITHYIDQNNAIDMYQTYFSGMNAQEPIEKYKVRIVNVFRDPFQRPISCIAWTNEKKSMIAVSYCKRNYDYSERGSLSLENNACYLWDVSVQNAPAHKFCPNSACWQLACSPKDPEIILGGLQNGTVCVFDIRASKKAIDYSSIYKSHREPVTALLYIHSRTQTDFFSGSPDGQCLWWDLRNLTEPLCQLPMSIRIPAGQQPDLTNAEGVSALEFDHGLPTKFLCGTVSGLVINVNRMGREHSEMLTSYWNAHLGPVRAVQRSPCTMRMFLTCGDYTVRIWSEEMRTQPIIVTTPYKHQVTDASWAPIRYSCYMSVCAGGYFYYWDLLRKSQEPVAILQVSKKEITKLAPHAKGRFVAIGDVSGSVVLIQLSENMVIPGSRDKQLVYQLYERESRREHIVDSRQREIHLKQKTEEEAAAKEVFEEIPDEDEPLQQTEDEYFQIVTREMQKMEIIPSDSIVP
ncbi:unnamed protein product [Chilo suppressalis]|uniref:Dynein intermediate chain 3, ciliary-like n=1 Tax=Chilo suppressalis TaxID=168631 RepID=A0ABN8AYF3_CHISP|nr:unnamed protein product [Chilo suppressalis]